MDGACGRCVVTPASHSAVKMASLHRLRKTGTMRQPQEPQTRDDSPRPSTAEMARRVLSTTRKAWAVLVSTGAARDETARAGQPREPQGGSLLGRLVNPVDRW